jgi:adenine deaminase
MTISGNIIDIKNRSISFGEIFIEGDRISQIAIYQPFAKDGYPYISPGFVDAHVHIESSMLTPAQFARLAVIHGTVGTVSDPHEIGNVLGVRGIEYMIENARKVPFKICFGAPPCVPATPFETAGSSITPSDIQFLFEKYPDEIGYLAEVMNFPGVLAADPDMMAKIAIAKRFDKPIDGHAPGLRGQDALRYAQAGPQTDHECFTAEEALDKLAAGMKIIIREGSAAKNFDALIGLSSEHYQNMMFCSDDKHPDNLVDGHINQLLARAVAAGYDVFKVMQMACINPVEHYRLPIGQLKIGDLADFVLLQDITTFTVLATYLNGQMVAKTGESLIENIESADFNNFECSPKKTEDFTLKAQGASPKIRVIECLNGQLITLESTHEALLAGDSIVSDVSRDLLKIVVVNRYQDAPVAVGFIKNFGLKQGAIASSVAHDSHNIVAVGVSDEAICEAVNLVIEARGGVSAVGNQQQYLVELPIAGLMSGKDGYQVAEQYAQIDGFAKETLCCTLTSPFMSLSFMALLVIPNLKMSDLGLFDGKKFSFTPLEV